MRHDTSASRYLDGLRRYISLGEIKRDVLLDKLDTLQGILERDLRDTLSRSSPDNPSERAKQRASERALINYSLPSRSLPNSPKLSKRSGRHFDAEVQEESDRDESTDEEDSSFARLSYLLERSIYEGRDALSQGSPLQRSAISDSMDPSSRAVMSHLAPGEILTIEHKPEPNFYIDDAHDSSLRSLVASDSELVTTEEPTTNDSFPARPPSYEDHESSPRSMRMAPTSLVDDGVAALEGLIDQLTAGTLQGRGDSGLTSTNLLILLSCLILIIAYLAAVGGYGRVGVNCHCTCPAS